MSALIVRLTVPYLWDGQPKTLELVPGQRRHYSGAGKTTLCRAVARTFGGTLRGAVCEVGLDGQEYSSGASKRAREAWPVWARTVGHLVSAPVDGFDELLASGGRGLLSLLAASGRVPVDVRDARLKAEAARKECPPDPGHPPEAVDPADLRQAQAVVARASRPQVEAPPAPAGGWAAEVRRLSDQRGTLATHYQAARQGAQDARAARDAASRRLGELTGRAEGLRAQVAGANERATGAEVRAAALVEDLRPHLLPGHAEQALHVVGAHLGAEAESAVADRAHEELDGLQEQLEEARRADVAAGELFQAREKSRADLEARGKALAEQLAEAQRWAAATEGGGPVATDEEVEAARALMARDAERAAWMRANPKGRTVWEVAEARRVATLQGYRDVLQAAEQDLDAIDRQLLHFGGESVPLRLQWESTEEGLRLQALWDGHPVQEASSGERVAAWALLRAVVLDRAGLKRPWLLVDDAQDWSEGFGFLAGFARVVEFHTEVSDG